MDDLDLDSSELYTKCPYCGRRVDPKASDVVYAVEQVDLPGMGQAHDFVDGMGACFHAGCSPERVGYAPRPRP
jgi:hypothetical protein